LWLEPAWHFSGDSPAAAFLSEIHGRAGQVGWLLRWCCVMRALAIDWLPA